MNRGCQFGSPAFQKEVIVKYLRQLAVILGFSCLGELLHSLISFPVPASIYGMVLLFLALSLGLVKLEAVKETGKYLVSIMSVLFVCPAVGLLSCWELLRDNLVPILVITAVSFLATFAVSGWVTQHFVKEDVHDEAAV